MCDSCALSLRCPFALIPAVVAIAPYVTVKQHISVGKGIEFIKEIILTYYSTWYLCPPLFVPDLEKSFHWNFISNKSYSSYYFPTGLFSCLHAISERCRKGFWCCHMQYWVAFFNFNFIVDTIADVPIFTPFAYLYSVGPYPPLPSAHLHTVVRVYASRTNILWLIPSPPFFQSHSSLSHLTAVGLFRVSMPLFLFCFSVYHIYSIPHISEIIWYLSS